ncbi:M14 family metallopeptidase [Lysinibacillus sp. BW-2-10]|uniref:M14 family metallopeptidase n=1 Tax=Lysinibacillus sp. BW-2-10 TaxID=2590030 RepID=UPI00118076F0|nr:M14 family zinc carboxypeptidase [Lysinibacillus sp. BW-2-10]TSI11026.1 LysM peptidoglycan-binding domain-containing protein [Lysinibacillus sp. BW-2-10]
MDVYVRPGVSFWYLSQVFSVPLRLIIDSNRDINPQYLTIGQRIRVPGYVTANYEIKPGDSLWSIARRNNLAVDTLYLVNPNLNPNRLQIGQSIRVPRRVTWRFVNGKQEYDYNTMMNDLWTLSSVYPFMQMSMIGDSVLGLDIPEVLIGLGSKRVHYNASFHANEWITTPVLMRFLNDYLLSLTNQNSMRGLSTLPLYLQAMLSVVPMVNPDGVNLVINGAPESRREQLVEWNNGSSDFSNWKANINGVDLNDQYPANWDLERERNPKNPGPRDYGGEAPLTQPEAIAMANLTRRRDFSRVLAFHTQGEVIYWGYQNMEPPEAEVIVKEFARVSGYEPVQTLESYAGYKDWFIQDWRRPGYTVELGTGQNPLPLSQFDEIYEETLGIFLAGLYM